MLALQSLRTWTTFNKFSTHRVTNISFLKYIITGLTLHSTAKQPVINALTNFDLTENNGIALKKCVSNSTILNSTNKRNPEDNRKDPSDNDSLIIFPAFDIYTKRIGFGNGTAVSKLSPT